MVLCAMVGWGNRSPRDKEKSYYSLPGVISTQGSKIYRDEYGAIKDSIAGFDEQVAMLLRKVIVSS